MRRTPTLLALGLCLPFAWPAPALADPCGMVPPVWDGPGPAITRVGAQQTYVFYKDGVESFVIRPSFSGKVDEFGMLIPFPSPPGLRKVDDAIFTHIAKAVTVPPVVIDLRRRWQRRRLGRGRPGAKDKKSEGGLRFREDQVKVLKQEAVGMYEVAVLAAGSAKALKKWMDQKGYRYPKGMDKVTQDYVNLGWCFVAVKTKVGQKKGVTPRPGMRKTTPKLPKGSTFDGNVQAMGFRFKTKRLVVPMRLSAFNAGKLHNIVYLLTDRPMRINNIPAGYVKRQITGDQLIRNLTALRPLRILGGNLDTVKRWYGANYVRNLAKRRAPGPINGLAKALFCGDMEAVRRGVLSLPHEEREKVLLKIGERLGLRGGAVDKLHRQALKKEGNLVERILPALSNMTLTVVDGDFPRDVLGRENLTFSEYVQTGLNGSDFAKPKPLKGTKLPPPLKPLLPGGKKPADPKGGKKPGWYGIFFGLCLLGGAYGVRRRRYTLALLLAGGLVAFASWPTRAFADPCGMVPPVWNGPGPAITRVGAQRTYVFYKEGVESFVIRPGFSGKVDEFGMLIPFPSVPALRKVDDTIFEHIANAVTPPPVVVDLRPRRRRWRMMSKRKAPAAPARDGLAFKEQVKVLKQEAVGMYEVAVLAAGSARALKKWMDEHGYQYPKGMDGVTQDYVDLGWCFVAVKTKVGTKRGVTPRAGMRGTKPKLPRGATFDGNVQAMGFRFKTPQLVVPMRLSAFNAGRLNNTVYLLTERPMRINKISEKLVVEQVPGAKLYHHLTELLPLKILGGTLDDLSPNHLKRLKQQRDPYPKNGQARDLFASDLEAVRLDMLALPHEEREKVLLKIGESLGLRGAEIDGLHREVLAAQRAATVQRTLAALKRMTLTVIKGDFPRDVLSQDNLSFSEYVRDGMTAAEFPLPKKIKGTRLPGEPSSKLERPEREPVDFPSDDDMRGVRPVKGVRHAPQPEMVQAAKTPPAKWFTIGLVALLAAACVGLSRGGAQ